MREYSDEYTVLICIDVRIKPTYANILLCHIDFSLTLVYLGTCIALITSYIISSKTVAVITVNPKYY